MGKNKHAAKAAWRAAARAATPLPTIANTGHSLVATITSVDPLDTNAANEPAPAPTQQLRDVHAQNACLVHRTPSLAPHTASASSNTAATSPSHPQPPFATPREPDRPSAATKRDSREVRSTATHPAPPSTHLASHTHIATAQKVPAQPRVPKSTRTPAKEPADTTHDAGSTYVHMRSPTSPPVSHLSTTTPHDPCTQPQRTIRPRAAENESKEGFGSREEEAHTVRDAHGGEPQTVRIPALPASRTQATTPRASRTPSLSTIRPRAAMNEPAILAGARAAGVPHPRARSVPPGSTTHAPATADESRSLGEARDEEAHALHARTETHAPPSAQSNPPSAPHKVPSSAHHDMILPTPGFEPGRPRAATALLFEEPNGELLNPAHLKEIVATALHDGHAAGLKEGRNAGFREGLEAGKRTGRAEGREEGLQEGLKRSRLEANQDARAASPIPHPLFAVAPCVSSIDDIDERLLHEIRYVAYNSGFEDGFAVSDKELEAAQSVGYVKGCKEESRRWEDRRPEQADAQTETTMPLTILQVDAHTQTCSPSANIPAPASFSWADEADSLPIHSVLPLPPPRDFSVLRSSSRSPFGSLQRRARRSHRADLRPSRSTFLSVPVITRHHPAGLRAGRPSIVQVSSPPSGFAVVPSPLSWDGDPRLVELSRVLRSLGWVRESSS